MANESILKEYLGSAVATTLATTITNVSTSIVLTDGSTYPTGASAPFVIVLDPGTATEEKVLCTSRSVNTITVLQRGYDGTSAQAHTAVTCAIQHVLDAHTVQHANRVVSGKTEAGASTTSGHPLVSNGSSLPQFQALTNAGVATAAAIAHTKMATVPRCFVHRASTQSIPHNTNTPIAFPDADTTDTNTFHDPASNNSRLTVPTGYGGVYLATYNVDWAVPGAGCSMSNWLQVNGVSGTRYGYRAFYNGDGIADISGGSEILELAAGDYVELVVFQNSGTACLAMGQATNGLRLAYLGPSA